VRPSIRRQGHRSLRAFGLSMRKTREPTSGLEPLTCSLQVIGHALQGVAQACKCRIFRGISFPCLAESCTVLRSRWYQSGINRGIAPSHSCSSAYAFEVRPEPRRVHQHTANPRPLLPLEALYGPQCCRRDGRGLGVATPLTGECKAT
jgi:hypothetical protein